MIKKIINYLYKHFCTNPAEVFFVEEKQYSQEETDVICKECSVLLVEGTLQKVIDMVYARSEHRQLYESTPDALLEKYRREGIATLKSKIQSLANLSKKKEEDQAGKFNAL